MIAAPATPETATATPPGPAAEFIRFELSITPADAVVRVLAAGKKKNEELVVTLREGRAHLNLPPRAHAFTITRPDFETEVRSLIVSATNTSCRWRSRSPMGN